MPDNIAEEPATVPSPLLTQDEIRSLVDKDDLILKETFDENCLQSAYYDLRLGPKAIVGGGTEIDLSTSILTIGPGAYAGVMSLENLKLPANILGRIGVKRRFSYEGIILLGGSLVDPGYSGHLLFGLYNASSKKVVLRQKSKICTITFDRLANDQKPVAPDPYLSRGDFPSDFLTGMTNMEVLPWAEISDKVKHIQELTKDVLDLKAQYNDVLEPIKALTSNVNKVTDDVRTLTEELRLVSRQVSQLDDLTMQNARQVTELVTSVKVLAGEVGNVKESTSKQGTDLKDVTNRFARFSAAVYAFWAIILVMTGVLINEYIVPALKHVGHH